MPVLIAVDGGPVSGEVVQAVAALLDERDAVDLMTVIRPDEIHGTFSASRPPHIQQPAARGALGGTIFTIEAVPVENASQAAARIDEEHRRQLEQLAEEHLPASLTHTIQVRQAEHPAAAIVELARELNVGAIAVGTRARSDIVKAVLGSVAEEVVRTAGRPVITIHVSR